MKVVELTETKEDGPEEGSSRDLVITAEDLEGSQKTQHSVKDSSLLLC